MKICNKCKQEKEYIEFCNNKNSPDGKNYTCKPCKKILDKQHFIKNKTKLIKINTEWSKNNRERRHSQFPWQQISKLPSYGMLFRHYLLFENIPISKQTVESIPGEVILINTDQAQLDKDEQEIYRLCNE